MLAIHFHRMRRMSAVRQTAHHGAFLRRASSIGAGHKRQRHCQ